MRIGIDLGGTKTEVIALGDRGETLYRHRLPTPRDDYQGTLNTIATLVNEAEKATGMTGSVGVGIPGTLSPLSHHVKNANSVWLNDQPLDNDLSALLQRPVRLANDANCLAVSEAVGGAGLDVVFAIIIGTGCGAGIALNGRAHAGRNGIAGEWGHNPLPWQNEQERQFAQTVPCYCGQSGCIETLFPAPVSLPTIAMSRAMPVTGKPLFHWRVREIAPQNKHCNAMSNVWPNPLHT